MKKAYRKPTLNRHGTLAALTQFSFSFGP